MSRSGYSEDTWESDQWGIIRWRGAVNSAIRGKRGQAFLQEMLAALDAMPDKRLVSSSLVAPDGVCAMGAVGKARGLDMTEIDPEDSSTVSGKFGIAEAMVKEISYMNDEWCDYVNETPEQRYTRMRSWIVSSIREAKE